MSYLFNELMAVFTLETHNPSSILRIVYLGNYPLLSNACHAGYLPWGRGTNIDIRIAYCS